jgi:hypothetical protein
MDSTTIQWIGLRENLQENPISYGKIEPVSGEDFPDYCQSIQPWLIIISLLKLRPQTVPVHLASAAIGHLENGGATARPQTQGTSSSKSMDAI